MARSQTNNQSQQDDNRTDKQELQNRKQERKTPKKTPKKPSKIRDLGNYGSKSRTEEKRKRSDFISKTLNTKFYRMKEERRGVATLKSLH